jgi:hypothetical protein
MLISISSFLTERRRKAANVRMENANDINKLLEFFNECTLQNPKFYWDAQLDENGVIKNLFLES